MEFEEEIILDYLKKNGRTAISKLSLNTKIHYYRVKTVIQNLDKQGKITIEKTGLGYFTYIKLKEDAN